MMFAERRLDYGRQVLRWAARRDCTFKMQGAEVIPGGAVVALNGEGAAGGTYPDSLSRA
jgi:hypothetical protein